MSEGYRHRQQADEGRFARIEADQDLKAVWRDVRAVLVELADGVTFGDVQNATPITVHKS